MATGKLVNAARLAGRVARRAAAGPADAGDDLRARGLHPRLRRRGRRPARRRSARSCATSTTTGSPSTSRCCARTAEEVVATEPRARLEFEVKQQYPNMRTLPRPHPEVSEAAEEALRREGFEPRRVPIRGGTDGSILSARGLPTPNLFTGGHEYHSGASGRRVQDMASAAAVAVRLAGRLGRARRGPAPRSARADRRRRRAGGAARPRAPSGRLLRQREMDAAYVDLADRAPSRVRLPAPDARLVAARARAASCTPRRWRSSRAWRASRRSTRASGGGQLTRRAPGAGGDAGVDRRSAVRRDP